MVKSKKMSKSTIAVIVLSILLVLSLVIGVTGAWFTASGTAKVDKVTMKFGMVSYTLTANTTVTDTTGATPKDSSGAYLLTAGTVIKTGITIKNASTVDTYYVLAHDGKYYSVDATNGTLVEVSAATSLPKLAPSTGASFERWYKVADNANAGTAEGAIWQMKTSESGTYSSVTLTSGALQFGANVDLGLKLISGTYELRAVQATNMTQADAYTKLTTGWQKING